MKTAAILLAPIAFSAALASAGQPPPRTVTTRIGETVHIHGVRFRALHVVEDSRCLKDAPCLWAGRLRLLVRMGGATGITREMTLGEPIPMTGGTLKLAAVLPERTTRIGTINPGAYRFAFVFQSNGRIEFIND